VAPFVKTPFTQQVIKSQMALPDSPDHDTDRSQRAVSPQIAVFQAIPPKIPHRVPYYEGFVRPWPNILWKPKFLLEKGDGWPILSRPVDLIGTGFASMSL
jgi:hypothetical protein